MPYDGAPTTRTVDLKRHKARARKAREADQYWQSLYDDCYRYAIPYRKPARYGEKGQRQNVELYDDTAISSTFHGAGSLKEDLFPSGTPWFRFEPGPVGELVARQKKENNAGIATELSLLSDQIAPFFATGEFDQCATEMCIDLYAGTGAILPCMGHGGNQAVRFVTIPSDELALENGAYGAVCAAYWLTRMSRRAIKAQFPKGTWPAEFTRQLEGDGAEAEIDLCQDFVKNDADDGWSLVVYCGDCADADPPVFVEDYKTQPIIIARYHRVPGEEKGRGPIMLALPAIKTVNKAQELKLKSFAIQMLGIWGYRPGGAFNPDVNKLKPGAMWPMNSTAGVMGPDVQRLDPAAGRVDYANLVTNDLQDRIKTTLHDERVGSAGKTPVSAAEYVGNMARMRENYIGAFGRLVYECIPPLVRRVMEILHKAGMITVPAAYEGNFDNLIIQIRITSPLAAAMKTARLKPLLDYLQLLQALGQAPQRFLRIEAMLDDLRDVMEIPGKYRTTVKEREEYDAKAAQQQAAQMAAEAVAKKPEAVAGALNPANQPMPQAA